MYFPLPNMSTLSIITQYQYTMLYIGKWFAIGVVGGFMIGGGDS